MPFPEAQRVTYNKPTLTMVVCQLRFPTILRIGAGQPADFQDKVREHYPLYSEQEPMVEIPQLPKDMMAILEKTNLPRAFGPATHRFSTPDSQRFISLSQEFLALRESVYLRWEDFRDSVVTAESALQEVYQPAFYSRIGLRYRNMIVPSALGLAESSWDDLLQPHILGELADSDMAGHVLAIQTQTAIDVPEVPGGRVRMLHGLVEEEQSHEKCYMIDADFSVEQKEGVDDPFGVLGRFNRLAGRLFRWAITDTLHEAMGPSAI